MGVLKNKPVLGMGIYTPPDISIILQIPQQRIRWYINEVWDNRFGRSQFNERYSWALNNQRAVNFLVLIEFKIVLALHRLGISTRKILQARNNIAKENSVPYPFASSRILADSKSIRYRFRDAIVDADGSRQLTFDRLVEDYYGCIEFDPDDLAKSFWPRGRDSSIIVDRSRQFGSPIIEGTNISARTIHLMHESGDSVSVLSKLYEVSEKNIRDAIGFYRQAV